jgi:hypothetical protein
MKLKKIISLLLMNPNPRLVGKFSGTETFFKMRNLTQKKSQYGIIFKQSFLFKVDILYA